MDYYYKKSGSIFNAHSYWTKQPVDVIQSFINKFSDPGDLVMDPFCGSGMTGVACIKTNRNFILSDISPICLHIARGYTQYVDTSSVFEIAKQMTSSILPMYSATCPDCSCECNIDYTILEDKLEAEHRLEAQQIVFHCPNCKKKIRKTPDIQDLSRINCSLPKDIYIPKDFFFGEEPKRNYKRGINQVYQLYSQRNLCALAILLDNINRIADASLREFFLFSFTSIVFNCSIMSRYNPKYENTQIKMGTFYIPSLIKDNNVVLSFFRKVNSIIKAQNEIFQNSYNNSGDVFFSNATNLSKIADSSIDYIYTDPPYSDKISYSELNLVYESWLGSERTNRDDEMVVKKDGTKGIDEYAQMFQAFLSEAYRVLKPKKYLTIVFHNSNMEHWVRFQRAIASSGFSIAKNTSVDRMISTAKTSTQYQSERDSQCFLVFTLVKDEALPRIQLEDLPDDQYNHKIKNLREEAIIKGFVSKSDQFDYIISQLFFSYIIKPYDIR